MLNSLRKNKINAQWRQVTELEVGMRIAVPKQEVLELHKAGEVNSREWMGDDILWDEIESIRHVGREQVWDIEVEGTHNFVGNDIFAHNTYTNIGAILTASVNTIQNLDLKIEGLDARVAALEASAGGSSNGSNFGQYAADFFSSGLQSHHQMFFNNHILHATG